MTLTSNPPRGLQESDSFALDVHYQSWVFNLDCRDGVDGMRSAKGRNRDLREPEAFGLPGSTYHNLFIFTTLVQESWERYTQFIVLRRSLRYVL